MTRLSRALRVLVATAIMAASGLPLAVHAAEDSDVIQYRQNLMKAIDAQTAALGMILSGAAPAENLVSHLETIALVAAAMPSSFEANVQGGEASPEIWTKWADFSERMNAFTVNTANIAKIAKEQGQDAIMSELATALSCKACHDLYRTKN